MASKKKYLYARIYFSIREMLKGFTIKQYRKLLDAVLDHGKDVMVLGPENVHPDFGDDTELSCAWDIVARQMRGNVRKKTPYFFLYFSLREEWALLTDEQRGKLFKTMLDYGEEVIGSNGNYVRPNFDEDEVLRHVWIDVAHQMNPANWRRYNASWYFVPFW